MTETNAHPRRLYLFQVATGVYQAGDEQIPMSAGCYLVQWDDGRNILIDTGFPDDYAAANRPGMQRGPHVLQQLESLGITPAEIDTVICTHLDIDHAGYHAAFPNAEFVVQRAHLENARGGNPRYDASRPYWDRPDLNYRTVEGDVELLPGLRLLATSGHVIGHQSVMVDLPETGPVLLAIDAVSMARAFTPDRIASPIDEDETDLRASTARLLDLVDREGVALTIFHHDGAQWAALRTAPEWYG